MLARYDERLRRSVHDTTGEFDVQGFMGGLIRVGGDMTLVTQLDDMFNRFTGRTPQGRRL